MGDMSKKIKLLFVIALFTVASLAVTNQVNARGYSGVSPMLPIDYNEVSYSGCIVVDDGEHYNFMLDSMISVQYKSDGAYHCMMTMGIKPDWTYNTVLVSYEYDSSSLTPVPIGSETVYNQGLTSLHAYTDSMTGDVLTFRLVDGVLDRVSIEGRSVYTSHLGDRSFLGFDVDVDYRSNTYYVADQDVPLPGTMIFNVIGEEDSNQMSGTVTIRPLTSYIYYNDEGSISGSVTWYNVDIDIQGSVLQELSGDLTFSVYEGGFIQMYKVREYLCGDVVTQVSITIHADPDHGIVLDGFIIDEVLDAYCDTVSSERIDFHYEEVLS